MGFEGFGWTGGGNCAGMRWLLVWMGLEGLVVFGVGVLVREADPPRRAYPCGLALLVRVPFRSERGLFGSHLSWGGWLAVVDGRGGFRSWLVVVCGFPPRRAYPAVR